MSKKQFRIGDLAKELKVKKFVIRFWEKEFDIKSDRSGGGQRFYTSDDLKLFLMIKDLLYNQGFTIAGAKKQLETPESLGGAVREAEPLACAVQDLEEAAEVQECDDIPHSEVICTEPDEMVTPATLASTPCACGPVVEKLETLKAQLAQLKILLEQQ